MPWELPRFFGIVWVVLCAVIPNQFIRIFMDPTEAGAADRALYYTELRNLILLPLNIFSTLFSGCYEAPGQHLWYQYHEDLLFSGILVLLLPALVVADALWFAMPITELFTAVYAVVMMRNYTRKLAG